MIAQQPIHHGKKRRPNERRARRARERERRPTCRRRAAAFVIETRSAIPQEPRDCEQRACTTSNPLATESERERRCDECHERERDRARVSPTAPHDKDRHSRRRNEQGERRATSARPLASNITPRPLERQPLNTGSARRNNKRLEAWAPAIANPPPPRNNKQPRAPVVIQLDIAKSHS